MTKAQFFMMMYGGLFLTVLVFSVIAAYIVTRPNFKAHGVEDSGDEADMGTDDGESSTKTSP